MQESNVGFAYHEWDGDRLLYSWSKFMQPDWTSINIYSVNDLMQKSNALQRQIILLTSIIIFAGMILTIFLATWLSKPIRDLVRMLRQSNQKMNRLKGRNEYAFIEESFKRMQEEEEILHRLLNSHKKDASKFAIHNLLRGEVSAQMTELFPHPYFMIVLLSIDRFRKYVAKNSLETRTYLRYLLISEIEDELNDHIHVQCVYRGNGYFAMVINYEPSGNEEAEQHIEEKLRYIQAKGQEILGQSITMGISTSFTELRETPDHVAEAMEAIKYRVLEGSGSIIHWREEPVDQKYIYPINSERRILNYLDHGDLKGIIHELEIISKEIRSAELAYENIMFIYYQLIGVTIKHLRENNINTSKVLASRGNIYVALASLDTLEEMEQYLCEFFDEIMLQLTRSTSDSPNYGELIINYLEQHYREDINFEDMAKHIGISYSYIRRIVNELTGQSLNDYLNQLRIEKAKQLLVEKDMTIAQISSEVGYYNVQSFNRFFRKFEGLPPSSYRSKLIKNKY